MSNTQTAHERIELPNGNYLIYTEKLIEERTKDGFIVCRYEPATAMQPHAVDALDLDTMLHNAADSVTERWLKNSEGSAALDDKSRVAKAYRELRTIVTNRTPSSLALREAIKQLEYMRRGAEGRLDDVAMRFAGYALDAVNKALSTPQVGGK